MEETAMKNGDEMSIAPLSELASVILGYVAMYPDGVHGYHLGRILSRSPLGLPTLRLGQLYRILHHLERVGLVKSHVEATGPRPARYSFVVTAQGRSIFLKWLTSLPHDGSAPVREQVLNRLRFSHRLPASDVRCLLEEAALECQEELGNIHRHKRSSAGLYGEVNSLHLIAVEARLAADRRWLDEIRSLVGEPTRHAGAGALPSAEDAPGCGRLHRDGQIEQQQSVG
jgi:DNA-binding PadR family transcriptional regulator